MNAILKTLSLLTNKNRRNKVFTMIKQQQKIREYTARTDFLLNFYVLVILNSTVPQSLTTCILNFVDIFLDAADVTYKQHVNVTQMFPRLYIYGLH